MKKINSAFIVLFITISITNINLIAQSNDNLDYFPHKDGDMWEYFFYDGPDVDTSQVFNHYDSTDADGNIFITQTSRYINPISVPAHPFPDTIQYKIDTLNQVWAHFGEVEYGIAFKLDAKQGDQWILKTYQHDDYIAYEMARVIVFEQNYFGNTYSVMNTHYYYTEDSTDTLGLSRYGQELAKGLGCVWLGGGDLVGVGSYLIGAVVDGLLYGDTTSVITSVENYRSNSPTTFELKQNYPNPFNAGTNINFSLSQPANLSLIIYNIEGKEVYRLLSNKRYSAGNYSIPWNGKNSDNQKVSSGVYFYSILQNTKPIKTKSMILIK
ncbi:MAG: FlgD immunoglobulin-like domain containing protein [Bacteroidota bacterium]